MALRLDWFLNNITTLDVNTSVLGNVNTAAPNLVTNANTVSLGFFGLGIMICIFIYLIIRTTSASGSIRMDFPRSLQLSSGLVFVLGYLMNVSGLVSSYNHALWFFTLFVASTIWIYFLKRSNQ